MATVHAGATATAKSMLSETVTEVSLTQGEWAQEWPPALWPLLQPSPSLTPAWAPGRARTPEFAASGVWAAAPSEGWIWGKETREEDNKATDCTVCSYTTSINKKLLQPLTRCLGLGWGTHLPVCGLHINIWLATCEWDNWLLNQWHRQVKEVVLPQVR